MCVSSRRVYLKRMQKNGQTRKIKQHFCLAIPFKIFGFEIDSLYIPPQNTHTSFTSPEKSIPQKIKRNDLPAEQIFYFRNNMF